MSIISLQYLLFIAAVCLIYYVVPDRVKKYVLLISSYLYFWINSNKLIAFLLVSTLVIYFSGIAMGNIDMEVSKQCEGLEKKEKKPIKAAGQKKKQRILLCSLLINLGLLVGFKYTNFLTGTFNSIFGTNIPQIHLLLPLGISYYTLQAVSYCVDVYRGGCKPSRNFGKVALYLAFFPHIVEGPFSRFADVGEQLSKPHAFDYKQIKFGAQLMIWGYFKKMVIADRAAQYVNQAFSTSMGYTGPVLILGVILYTVQIYAEFSGCIDIMTGIAQLFGVRLPSNFRQPFFALTVQEFWQRWHITLGGWLKEYVFYPVSCSKWCRKIAGVVQKRFSRYIAGIVSAGFAMLFVWLGNGIWHGSSWKYIFYGLYYYGLMMAGMICAPLFKKILVRFRVRTESLGYKFLQICRTNAIVLIGMMIFRAESFKGSIRLFFRLFSLQHVNMLASGEMFRLGLGYAGEWFVLLIGMLVIFAVDLFHEKGYHLRETLAEQPLLFRWLVYYMAIFAILIFGSYGIGYDAQAFIYAGF